MHTIECPHCEKFTPAEDWQEHEEEEPIDADCANCGKEFTYHWQREIDFTVHELKQTT